MFIGNDARLASDLFTNCALQSFGGHVGNDAANDSALPLHGYKYGSLTRSASALAESAITRLTANVHLITFNRAAQFRCFLIRSHRKPDAVHQEQRRLVADLAMPLDFESGDAFLRCASSPECIHPMPQFDARFLVNRTDTHRV